MISSFSQFLGYLVICFLSTPFIIHFLVFLEHYIVYMREMY